MDTDDLNEFIRKLNPSEPLEVLPNEEASFRESAENPIDTEEASQRLKSYLAEVARRNATDLLLVPGAPPTIRLDGALTPLNLPPLSHNEAATILLPSLSAERRRRFMDNGSVDLSITLPPVGRFRVNLHQTRQGCAAAIRLLPKVIPGLTELGLPESLGELTRQARGLILITGPTGCGKSTTLAALVDLVNRRDRRHIVTIEDPVEYEHTHRTSVVEQVEVGSDATTFADALRSTLRQDPDVIQVGEVRDLETISIALTAAETGHLVLTTAHTNNAPQTIHRIVDVFPSEQQPQIRQQLALALTAIVYQQLLPKKSGSGRVVACEVLIATDGVRTHIRNGTLHHLHTEMTLGKRFGMMTLEDSLARLIRADLLNESEAKLHSSHPEELASLLRSSPMG